MPDQCVRAWVTGKVQGVGYRRSMQSQALTLGVTGYAHNLPDGRVEALMCGPAESIVKLCEWLRQGPPNAHVTHVDIEVVDDVHVPDHFSTR
ncbi:acylphosphatase [Halomonas dongshanensis]|uniref:acylphosphatase n=1 Tax=Halomonas dongshanensis TaxID=2890835 RepID=A0ABT2EGG8_9GAMM|nr:acylphosphatase [Halomonas dongshanensis]MCS2610635.1 acylphosphatase [Halomonas dongshanensis]